ncbi:hypothetical protein HacjB3_16586 (plasmid) [Halalkalicoccus jeotgali B3]|uniref:Uncharacterized protein n=1 Tax=Halalkalicoccus jeotgali (strain DSM 18796 / CECT 7217 / JCM 14584 / KCTC 4019 / B3) TaxID=795797 RepID=D8JBL4_HALJB|nr:hypothetical protein HacjB3_16586 [Halalkalicoccus jeotgali B3]
MKREITKDIVLAGHPYALELADRLPFAIELPGINGGLEHPIELALFAVATNVLAKARLQTCYFVGREDILRNNISLLLVLLELFIS